MCEMKGIVVTGLGLKEKEEKLWNHTKNSDESLERNTV